MVPAGTTQPCRFSTDRLVAEDWHQLADRFGLDLVDVATTMLTSAATRELPPEWRGEFDRERAAKWIRERDSESPTLLVADRTTAEPIGLLILFEAVADDDPQTVDLRLGYVVGEAFWGRGVATELVAGLVRWAEAQPAIRSVSAGVTSVNVASARVLVKNGFSPTDDGPGEQVFRLDLR